MNRLYEWPEAWMADAFNKACWAYLKGDVTEVEFVARARVLFRPTNGYRQQPHDRRRFLFRPSFRRT
jgi:hypothetical protein